MTTDQRIDRLKLQMIELSQKLDQLLEGQAQTLAVYTRHDQNMDITTEGPANLTSKTDHLSDSGNALTDN